MTEKDFQELMILLDQMEEIVKKYPSLSEILVNIINIRYLIIQSYSTESSQDDEYRH